MLLCPQKLLSRTLIGDFNAHIDWWQHDEPLSSDAADDTLLDTVTTTDLHQVCQHPSYSSQGRASFLDLVFVRNISRVTSCEVLPGLTGSNHSAIEIFLCDDPTTQRSLCTNVVAFREDRPGSYGSASSSCSLVLNYWE
ncbi:hypothetical protein HPB49_009940 [Dermacentor silvarum]|uniref:Uncharacterized protein n=1 Tax=Dermacentor silvarum TaxID=543639 RepID=A0ACB8CQZ5_DERSI|nr:hypothetical protein HPB49_009940 [Dermacentor silvarum]